MVLSDRHYDATKCATSIVGDCLANDRDRLGRRKRRSVTDQRPQSSSASRFTAGAFGFLTLTQSGERPRR